MVIESSGPLRPAPAFILCAARTGSTLLRYLLDTHPQLCAPPELQIGALCERLMWLHTYTTGEEQEIEPAWAAASARRRTRRVVDEIMHDWCRRVGKPLWCEKSIDNLARLETLDAVYPDARLVFLHRHVLDTVASLLDVERETPGRLGLGPWLARRPERPFEALVDYWCDATERLLGYEKANARRAVRVRYEDLVRRPRRTLPRVFEVLDLEWDPGIVDRVFVVPHARGPGDARILSTGRIETSSIGRGASLPWRELAAERLARTQALLDALGYPPLGE